jgi:hypothetical protein
MISRRIQAIAYLQMTVAVVRYEHRTTMSHATQHAHVRQHGDSLYIACVPFFDL